MTRFIYVADTHIGTRKMGYEVQAGYPGRLPAILDGLCRWAGESGPVDFIIHGGDMVDDATRENIRAAKELFSLPFPVYLCLGNHDVTGEEALDLWLEEAPDLFPGGNPTFSVTTGDCCVHVAPNQWDDIPFHWQEEMASRFLRSCQHPFGFCGPLQPLFLAYLSMQEKENRYSYFPLL